MNKSSLKGKKPVVKRFKLKKKVKTKDEDIIKGLQESYKLIDSAKVQKFTDLPLSQKTLKGLTEQNFSEPTEIQRESLKFSLSGLDILGAAKTGSGKTLAFLIPVIERLFCERWATIDGLGALIITPTRELAFQIFETLRKFGQFHDFSAGLIIGGKDLKFESKRMDRCNIVIGTPGRILQHMDENPLFDCSSMKILVLDEADRCLDMGFEKSMNAIIENLPSERQTLLFSATQTKSVKDLARLSLHDPVYVSVHEHATHATPEGLRQSYVVAELHDKMATLWSFLKNHAHKKILVFLSSCKQVKYVYEVLCRLRPGVSLLALYGTLHQMRRMAVYDSFCRKKNAVLFATDIAARGLDFPAVDWVVQLDCPEDAATYLHRAGRTARYASGGEALLVLTPSEEEAMLENLAKQRVPIERIQVNPRKLQTPQRKMEALLARDPELKASAQRAFVSYLKAVFLMKDKKVFDVHALDTDAFARSLGLAAPPRVRFLQRQQKRLQAARGPAQAKGEESSGAESSEEEERHPQEPHQFKGQAQEAYNFNIDSNSEDEEEDDMLTLKRRDHHLEGPQPSDPESPEDEDTDTTLPKPQGSKNVITKAALAKRIIKKKIVANKKTVFDEEGEAVRDAGREKVSEAARQYEAQGSERGGIVLSEAKMALREEDKFDKQRFKERLKAKRREAKQKLKAALKRDKVEDQEEESDEESEGPDLSWLPDPDKIYGKEGSGEGEASGDELQSGGEEGSSGEDNSSEGEESDEPPPKKRKNGHLKHAVSKASKPSKKPHKGLSLQEEEELALQFLRSRR